jgi:hypothetical protein
MLPSLEQNTKFQDHVKEIWIGLMAFMQPNPPPLTEQLHAGVVKDVEAIRSRGGKVIFLRLPSTGKYLELEKERWPRAQHWETLLKATASPGVHFEDHAALSRFTCPEWSHLSVADAIVFTRELVNVLKEKSVLPK